MTFVLTQAINLFLNNPVARVNLTVAFIHRKLELHLPLTCLIARLGVILNR